MALRGILFYEFVVNFVVNPHRLVLALRKALYHIRIDLSTNTLFFTEFLWQKVSSHIVNDDLSHLLFADVEIRSGFLDG